MVPQDITVTRQNETKKLGIIITITTFAAKVKVRIASVGMYAGGRYPLLLLTTQHATYGAPPDHHTQTPHPLPPYIADTSVVLCGTETNDQKLPQSCEPSAGKLIQLIC
jgi:hypothetical protein